MKESAWARFAGAASGVIALAPEPDALPAAQKAAFEAAAPATVGNGGGRSRWRRKHSGRSTQRRRRLPAAPQLDEGNFPQRIAVR